MLVGRLLQVGVVFFLSHDHFIFGEYTCTFVMHMVYDILVVDMVVYDMQV